MRLCFIGGGNPLNRELDDVMYYLSNSIEIGNGLSTLNWTKIIRSAV